MEDKTLPKELTLESLKSYTEDSHYMTVGQLKDFINRNNIPDDSPVLIERVEDSYYDKDNGWEVYYKRGFQSELTIREINRHNECVDNDACPQITERIPELTEEELKYFANQYHPAFSCVLYTNETDKLFINLHY